MNSATWKYDQKATGERIAALMRQRGQKKSITRHLNRSKASASQWVKGEGLTVEVLGGLAEYFKCSVDYILGLTQSPPPEPDERASKIIAELKRIVRKYETPARDLNYQPSVLGEVVQRGIAIEKGEEVSAGTSEESDAQAKVPVEKKPSGSDQKGRHKERHK